MKNLMHGRLPEFCVRNTASQLVYRDLSFSRQSAGCGGLVYRRSDLTDKINMLTVVQQDRDRLNAQVGIQSSRCKRNPVNYVVDLPNPEVICRVKARVETDHSYRGCAPVDLQIVQTAGRAEDAIGQPSVKGSTVGRRGSIFRSDARCKGTGWQRCEQNQNNSNKSSNDHFSFPFMKNTQTSPLSLATQLYQFHPPVQTATLFGCVGSAR